jgi:hypothetical protein
MRHDFLSPWVEVAIVVQFAVIDKEEVELRLTDSRGRLSPHQYFWQH